MRFSIPSVLALLVAPIAVAAASDPSPPDALDPPRDRKAAVADDDDGRPKATVFNGQTVPPITEIEGPRFKESIAHGYWLVKAFSPSCIHCQRLAPKFQTIYEYYYTSDPLPASSDSKDSQAHPNSFTNYFDFKFASLNCQAYMDACVDIGVSAFPTLIVYKDGVEIKKMGEDKSMEKLSGFIEESLEMIKPGSRPKIGVELPKVGAHNFNPGVEGKSKPPGPDTGRASSPLEKTIAPPKGRPAANPTGKSIDLTPELFNDKVRNSLTPWFIKFYAPWCHHCQAMGPAWTTMAREMKDKLDVGEVNCEVHKQLCKQIGVRSYPTMKFFRGPDSWEYTGLRATGDLIDYGDKAAAVVDGIKDVSLAEFEEMEKRDEVVFVYLYDYATTSEDFLALDRLPLHTLGKSKLVKSQDKELAKKLKVHQFPALTVYRSGQLDAYPGTKPEEIRDVEALVDWMKAHWLPLVPEISAANSHDVFAGSYVAVAILNRERVKEFAQAKNELKQAAVAWTSAEDARTKEELSGLREAKRAKIQEAEDRHDAGAVEAAKAIKIDATKLQGKPVKFAWIDGIFWDRWLRTTFGVSVRDGSGEKIIIYDYDTRRYWDLTASGGFIMPVKTSIMETVRKAVAHPPLVRPKMMGSWVALFFWRMKNAFVAHPLLCVLILVGAVGLFVTGSKYMQRKKSWARSNGFMGHSRKDSREGLIGYGYVGPKGD